jgi:hypothetical protein
MSMVIRGPVSAPFAAALAEAGFQRRVITRGPRGEVDAWRRPAPGGWVIEAHEEVSASASYVDVGLTLDSGRGTLLGPVHRALSPSALASALPHVTASLEALAAATDTLRCPDCTSGESLAEDAEGPFLACGQPGRGRRTFDRSVRRCRRDLVMAMLVVHREPGAAP